MMLCGALTFHLVPQAGQGFHLFRDISQRQVLVCLMLTVIFIIG